MNVSLFVVVWLSLGLVGVAVEIGLYLAGRHGMYARGSLSIGSIPALVGTVCVVILLGPIQLATLAATWGTKEVDSP